MDAVIHFYHVYADGKWQDPVGEHTEALKIFGLLDELDNIYVGYVGSNDNIKQAEKFIKRNTSGKAETINKSNNGWEQETMRLIPGYLTDQYVLYCHSKGSSDPSLINMAWRRDMTMECVVDWRRAVTLLKKHDAVGSHWVEEPEKGRRFFGGTYWWAKAEYLLSLPPVGEETRFHAEYWIGEGQDPKIYDLKPGHPVFIPLDTDWRVL